MQPRVTCVVPARLGSTRFFGKLLTPLFGKPVVVHALERAAGAGCFDRVVCLTDSAEIGSVVAEHGFAWVLSGEASNGTERIGKSLESLDASDTADAKTDLFVNLQGDEPAFPEDGLRALCAAIVREPDAVHLLVHAEAPTDEEIANPNRVKVSMGPDGSVKKFFRKGDFPAAGMECRLQLGAYAYPSSYLAAYAALPPSAEEIEMSHEMLRAPGLAPMRAHDASPGASVDVPEDLIAAERALILNARRGESTATNTERQPSLQGAPA